MGKGNGISTTQHKVVWRSRLAGKLPFMETRITDKVKRELLIHLLLFHCQLHKISKFLLCKMNSSRLRKSFHLYRYRLAIALHQQGYR